MFRRDRAGDPVCQTPNIREPGADSPDFPNSPVTLCEDHLYVETLPVGFYGASQQAPAEYNWEFLVRYGWTDNLEVRIYTAGLTVGTGSPASVDIAPPLFDFKFRLWEENPTYGIPALGIEVGVLTGWGTASLANGTQPAINLLFNKKLWFDTALEWNIGVTAVIAKGLATVFEERFSGSLRRDVVEDVAMFVHGYYNMASLPRGLRDDPNIVGLGTGVRGGVIGAGAVWTVDSHVSLFTSLSRGLNAGTPSYIVLGGFAVAF